MLSHNPDVDYVNGNELVFDPFVALQSFVQRNWGSGVILTGTHPRIRTTRPRALPGGSRLPMEPTIVSRAERTRWGPATDTKLNLAAAYGGPKRRNDPRFSTRFNGQGHGPPGFLLTRDGTYCMDSDRSG